jgi:hypothetical protein
VGWKEKLKAGAKADKDAAYRKEITSRFDADAADAATGAKWLGSAPDLGQSPNYFYGGSPTVPEMSDMKLVGASKLGGYQARQTTDVSNLTHLMNFTDYFKQDGVVNEEDFEGGSVDGEVSDEEYDDQVDPEVLLKAQKDGVGGGYEEGRIDMGAINIVDNHLTPFEELADEALPKDVVGEGGGSPEAAREAAAGGLDPNFHSTPTRNLRDLEQMPFAGTRGAQRTLSGFGMRPGENTRERMLPGSIGEGMARRNLGLARQQLKSLNGPAAASPFPLAPSQEHRHIGPRHAGDGMKADPNEVKVNQDDPTSTINIKRTKERLKKFRTANRHAKIRDEHNAWDAPGLKTGMAPTMGEIAEADDESEYLSNEPGHAKVDENYFAPDRVQDELVEDRPNSIDLDEDLSNEKKLSIPALNAPTPKKSGFFSRLGGAIAKAGRVAGNALSSAGLGLKSLFGFGKKAAPAAADTSTAAERVSNVRNEEAAAEYERQQNRPGMAELQGALDDPVNQGTIEQAKEAGIDLRAPMGDSELEQLQRMMHVDPEPARDDDAKWLPEVMESRMYDDYVSPRDEEVRIFPEAQDTVFKANHFEEPDEGKNARARARRKAGIPSPESYTNEQADDYDLTDQRITRYQNEAFAYQQGDGVQYSGGVAPEDRTKIAKEFFSKFRENPRLSFKPYALNRQEDLFDAEEAGMSNPLGQKLEYNIDENYMMSDEDRKAKAAAEEQAEKDRWARQNEQNEKWLAIEAPYKKKRMEAEEKRRQAELQRMREQEDRNYELDLDSNAKAMKQGAEQATALHAGALDVVKDNYFSDALAGANVEGQGTFSQALNINENYVPEPSMESAVQPLNAPVSVAPEQQAPPKVINLPKNAANKAKLVGDSPNKADQAEAARMLQANASKRAENDANNKKFSYKAKKLFGKVKDQRIDPEYDGKTQREAAEIAMQARMAHEERTKNSKKKKK